MSLRRAHDENELSPWLKLLSWLQRNSDDDDILFQPLPRTFILFFFSNTILKCFDRLRWNRRKLPSQRRYSIYVAARFLPVKHENWPAFQGGKYDLAKEKNGWTNKCMFLLYHPLIWEAVIWSTYCITFMYVYKREPVVTLIKWYYSLHDSTS